MWALLSSAAQWCLCGVPSLVGRLPLPASIMVRCGYRCSGCHTWTWLYLGRIPVYSWMPWFPRGQTFPEDPCRCIGKGWGQPWGVDVQKWLAAAEPHLPPAFLLLHSWHWASPRSCWRSLFLSILTSLPRWSHAGPGSKCHRCDSDC